MYIEDLQWDDNNVEHIALHSVTPAEVEQVCYGRHLASKDGESENRYILGGKTEDSGRYLIVVIERLYKAVYKPITAFEMSVNCKKSYKKKLG